MTVVFLRLWKGLTEAIRDEERYRRDEEVPWFIGCMVSGAFLFISIVATLVNGAGAIKAIVAPKLVLIELVSQMLR